MFQAGIEIPRNTKLINYNQISFSQFKPDQIYVAKGAQVTHIPKSFFTDEIKPNMRLESIPKSIKVRWAAAVKYASVRNIPTDVGMLEEKGDVEFDMVQYSKIKIHCY